MATATYINVTAAEYEAIRQACGEAIMNTWPTREYCHRTDADLRVASLHESKIEAARLSLEQPGTTFEVRYNLRGGRYFACDA